jgi:bifunctional DNA-binding transcriptional regulator/antitoxin component of YhaV-PrlF toxin-antitoxin module
VVKARSRQGTKSLDLTIPVRIANEMNIKEGDVFIVQIGKNADGKLEIIYTRIFNGHI